MAPPDPSDRFAAPSAADDRRAQEADLRARQRQAIAAAEAALGQLGEDFGNFVAAPDYSGLTTGDLAEAQAMAAWLAARATEFRETFGPRLPARRAA